MALRFSSLAITSVGVGEAGTPQYLEVFYRLWCKRRLFFNPPIVLLARVVERVSRIFSVKQF
jgi:hypothetical protein